ncbi:MAG: molybdopterin-dependent oxidoreductase [Halanaeroarchaeum sp.]
MSVRDVTDLYEEFGAERLPPGQRLTEDFPVFSLSGTPTEESTDPSLAVTGAVEDELVLSGEELRELPTERQRQDFHCVTGWSKFDCEFTGVPLPSIAERATLEDDAVHVLFHAHDGYTTDLSLSEAMRDEVLLTWAFDGDSLPPEHGGPLRVVTPHKYAYKGAKWVSEIEFLTEPQRGYWEQRGYSSTADPWAEDRYS